MSVALYPGSFDPFTNGHLNILKHAAKIFDKVYLMVLMNPNKKRFTTMIDMENLIKDIINNDKSLSNVEVVSPTCGLTCKEAHRLGCDYLVRGIRNNGLDYSYEENLAEFNQEVGNINTIFIRADLNKSISSTMIKTLLMNGESISSYVPKQIDDYLRGYGL